MLNHISEKRNIVFPSRTFILLHNDDNMCIIIFHTNGGFYWCCRFFLLFPFEQFLYKSYILYSLKGSKTHTIKFRYQKTLGNCKSFLRKRNFSQIGTIAIMFLWSWNTVAYVCLYCRVLLSFNICFAFYEHAFYELCTFTPINEHLCI